MTLDDIATCIDDKVLADILTSEECITVNIDSTIGQSGNYSSYITTQPHASNRCDVEYVDVQALQEKVARLEKDLNTLKSVFSWLFVDDENEDEKSQS